MKRRLVETQGRRPVEDSRHSQLGRRRGDSPGTEGQPVRARARPGGQVRRDALRQRRHVAGRRRACSTSPNGSAICRTWSSPSSAKARARRSSRRKPSAAELTNVRFFPYQPKARLIDSFATRRCLHRVAEARTGRIHRAEQAVRHPRRRASVHRGGRSGFAKRRRLRVSTTAASSSNRAIGTRWRPRFVGCTRTGVAPRAAGAAMRGRPD